MLLLSLSKQMMNQNRLKMNNLNQSYDGEGMRVEIL